MRRRSGRRRRVPRQVRRRRRGREGDRRVRPEAGRGRSGGRARGRRRPRLGSVRDQQDPRVGRLRRRHRRRARRGRHRGRAPDRQPPHRGCSDRAARRGGRAPGRRRDPALVDPDPPHHPLRPLRTAGDERARAARGRARRRRRLRLEAQHLRRGGDPRRARPQAEAAGEVDRDQVGEHGLHAPRSRPDRLHHDRSEVRRDRHGGESEAHLRPRRVLPAPDPVHPGARASRLPAAATRSTPSTCTSPASSRTSSRPTRSAARGARR